MPKYCGHYVINNDKHQGLTLIEALLSIDMAVMNGSCPNRLAYTLGQLILTVLCTSCLHPLQFSLDKIERVAAKENDNLPRAVIVDWFGGWLTGWLLVRWLVGWLAHWFSGWLVV